MQVRPSSFDFLDRRSDYKSSEWKSVIPDAKDVQRRKKREEQEFIVLMGKFEEAVSKTLKPSFAETENADPKEIVNSWTQHHKEIDRVSRKLSSLDETRALSECKKFLKGFDPKKISNFFESNNFLSWLRHDNKYNEFLQKLHRWAEGRTMAFPKKVIYDTWNLGNDSLKNFYKVFE